MVKIRLKRMGYKRNPMYRIVVIDSRSKREGAPIEELGFYHPKRKEMRLDKAKALDWVSKGAQPTETVQYLINNCDENGGLIVKPKAKKLSKKALAKQEAEKEAAAQKAKEEAEAAEAAKAEESKAEEPAEAPAEEAKEEASAE